MVFPTAITLASRAAMTSLVVVLPALPVTPTTVRPTTCRPNLATCPAARLRELSTFIPAPRKVYTSG